jgi:hypothetical protein
MIWFWSRNNQKMQLETRYDNDKSEFVIAIQHPDGHHESERFSDIDVFQQRMMVLEKQFEAEQWTQSGRPLLIPAGFPNQRLASRLADRTTEDLDRIISTRTYTVGRRAFELILSMAVIKGQSLWTVEHVTETTGGRAPVAIPGIHAVIASTPEVTFARACDRIDKWLLSNA